MAKIASFTPIWNAELFIKPHFEMLSKLDKNIVFYNPKPWQEYGDQHYDKSPDKSIDMIRQLFPNVEIIETDKSGYPELIPSAMDILKDYDLIFRLDVDMLITSENWDRLIYYLKTTGIYNYWLDWSTKTINYYGDWEHGFKDALEKDVIVLSDKEKKEIDLQNFVIHHFRGWNKPKSIKKDWKDTMKDYFNKYSEWYSVPQEIRDMFDPILVKRWFDQI